MQIFKRIFLNDTVIAPSKLFAVSENFVGILFNSIIADTCFGVDSSEWNQQDEFMRWLAQ
jgi:hypothetical protein